MDIFPNNWVSSDLINSLPDNVLGDLFCWTVAVAENHPPTQYTLSSVCRHWRDLVLHCPLLWTDIYIPMKDPYDPFVFFERSAPAHYDVTFYSSWTQDLDFHAQVSHAILNNLSRLRRLTIDVINFDEIIPLFQAWSNRHAPNFQHLEILCQDMFEPEKDFTATFMNRGDTLRDVKLNGLRFKFLPNLPNLTNLEIDRLRPDPGTLRALFVQCPTLESLVIGVFSAPAEPTDPALPCEDISAPYLKRLAINLDNDHTESNCSCALPKLDAENLEYLEISHYGTTFADHYVSLASHFKASRHLHKLRIRSHLFMEEDMDFLTSLPNGTGLEIIGFPSHRDPGAGLPIVSLVNLESIIIDLIPTMSKYSSDFDIVAFHGVLQNTRLTFNCPVTVCCDCDGTALDAWKTILGDRFSIRPTPLGTGFLDNYLIPYDDFLDRLSGSSQDECYDWDDDDGDYQDYDDYDEEEDEEDYDPDAPCIGSEVEVEI